MVEICGVEEGRMGRGWEVRGREREEEGVGICGCGWFEGLLFWAVVGVMAESGMGVKTV